MKSGAIIYGAGGHARVIISILEARRINILGLVDDSFQGPETIGGYPLLGGFSAIHDYRNMCSGCFLAIGDNRDRQNAWRSLTAAGFTLPSLVHPRALLEPNVTCGKGSVVCLGAILATEVSVGNGTIINTGSSVDHESRIGDFVHLAPRVVVAGRTTIGNNTFIGMNSCVAEKLVIADNVTIGAGSIVLRDVAADSRITGVHH